MATRSRIPDDAGLFGYGLTQAGQDLKPVIEYLLPLGINKPTVPATAACQQI